MCSGFSGCGDYFASGGVDGIVMVWQSNIKSMISEHGVLNKNEISNLKSNKATFYDNNNLNSKYSEKQEKFKAFNTSVNKNDKKGTSSKYVVMKQENVKGGNNNIISKSNFNKNNSNENLDNNNSEDNSQKFKFPPELASTFNKLIFQMDHIVK